MLFRSPDTMPGWLKAFVDVNPISWLVTSVRGLMHGEASGSDIGKTLIACAVLVAVFAPLTMRAYRNKA